MVHSRRDGVCENPEMLGRTHFARFLVNSGEVKDVRTVFRKYLTPGKPGYVPQNGPTWLTRLAGLCLRRHGGDCPSRPL
jgi:predicted metal-dependent phosphoesterase TrpH